MKTKKIKGLYKGCAPVADKLVEPLIESGESLCILLDSERMELTSFELTNKRVAVSDQTYEDKFGGPDYLLYYCPWKPTAMQTALFEGGAYET